MENAEKIKQDEGIPQPTKPKQADDGGETDAETAASTPARSSVSTSNTDAGPSSSLPKTEVASLPTEIDTSKTDPTIVAVKNDLDEEDYSDWPLVDIKEPHANDVLYGRGGGTNHHPGNKKYRKMVEGRKVDYVNSKRLDKPLVALEIIKAWRSQKPPGRFLKLDERTSLWYDVGDKKAREKTSQALREKAPQLRKQQEEQRRERENENIKNTRFDVPIQATSRTNKNVKRVLLARDHSLGRDYISPDEKVTLEGFTWNSPVGQDPTDSWCTINAAHSADSARIPTLPDPYTQRDPYGVSPYSANSPARYNGDWPSHHPNPYHPHTPNDLMNNWRAGSRSDDGPSQDYGAKYEFGPTASADDVYHTHSYYPHPQAPPPPNDDSLEPDDYKRFAKIVGSGAPNNNANYMHRWKSMNSPRDGMYDSSPYQSPDRMNLMKPSRYGHHWNSPSAATHASTPSTTNYFNKSSYHPEVQRFTQPYPHSSNSLAVDGIPRPPNVKRDTSHKLQTGDVEPTSKKLNRQSSSGHRNNVSSIEEITPDMNLLTMKSPSSASSSKKDKMSNKTFSLKENDRLSTIDKIIVGIDDPDHSSSKFNKPTALGHSDRMTTVDQINLLVNDIDDATPDDGLLSLHESDEAADIGDDYKSTGLELNDDFNDSALFGDLTNTESV